ncbi:hypothetical protein CJU90_0506 [Yarrowia sp. C11]|nr:hypothetical protein CKK34_1918 [Yarrowia sp. E02]KAG5372849.1 hypothetical protein CJU90_0506 [Yarrowia sp. C11]
MTTRNIALEFLEKELEGHNQQLANLRSECDKDLRPLQDEKDEVTREIEGARSLIEGLEAKLKDFKVADKRLDEQINERKRKFEMDNEGIISRVTGLRAAVHELRRVNPVIEAKKEMGVIELESDESIEMDAHTDGLFIDLEPSISNDFDDLSCAEIALDSTEPETLVNPSSGAVSAPEDSPTAVTPATSLSSAEHATQILSQILVPALPSFEKRKSQGTSEKPPAERLKRRKPSSIEEVVTPGSKPHLKSKENPNPKPERQSREPLVDTTNVDPNSYTKQFGLRRKTLCEDSDDSWRDSDDDMEDVSFNAKDSELKVNAPVRRGGRPPKKEKKVTVAVRRGGRPPKKDKSVSTEIVGESKALVKDGGKKRGGWLNGMTELAAKMSLNRGLQESITVSDDSSMDASIDDLFFEKEESGLTDSKADSDTVTSSRTSDYVSAKPTETTSVSHSHMVVKADTTGAVTEITPWKPAGSSVPLATISPIPLPKPLSKLPSPQELGLILSKGTSQPMPAQVDTGRTGHNGFSPIPTGPRSQAMPLPPGVPTGPQRHGSKLAREHGSMLREFHEANRDPRDRRHAYEHGTGSGGRVESQSSLSDMFDYRERDITWDMVRDDPTIWAHLHSAKQLRWHAFCRGRYTSIKCMYPGGSCQHAFETLRDLRLHMFNVHGIKTYVCLLCNMSYGKKCDLWGHCKKHHDSQMGKYWRGHSDHV